MSLVISIIFTLLLYTLIQHDNLVNVTSLFYLMPGVTAVMGYLILGNPLSRPSLLGVLAGLALVFRHVR